ncbi:MAG: T9SS type A sorting domain-containing protein [Bacteroidales bacterium]|nr:T9SS type A sorting domain-containing protein [Bacteroidales bacterium]
MKTNKPFNISLISKYIFSIILLMAFLLSNGVVFGATFTARASTAWTTGTTWAVGGTTFPGAGDDVVIPSAYTVTLSANAACKNLTLQGLSGTRLSIGNFTLTVNGTLTGPNTTFSNNLITTGTGKLSFVGNSRTLFNNWSNAYTTGWRCEIALNTGATGASSSNVKFGDLIVTTGTFNLTNGTPHDLRIDGGSDGTGTVSIATNATLVVTGIMGVRNATPTTYCGAINVNGTLTVQGTRLNGTIYVNSGGVLLIKRLSNGSDLASNPTNNFIYATGSTLQYDLEGSVGTMPTGAEISQAQSSSLYNLTINNQNSINLKSSLTINGTLKIIAGSITTSASPIISYGSSGELYYQGTVAQTTSDLVFPSSNGPFNLTIDNASGVSLHANRTINGTVTVKTDAQFNAQDYTIDGSGGFNLEANATLITAHSNGLDGTNTTTGTSFYDDAANYIFNAPSLAQITGSKLPTIVNNLTVDGRSQLSLTNSTLTINGLLHVKAESSFDAKGVAIDGAGGITVDDGSTTTFISAHPNGLDGTNTTSGGSYFGVSNYIFNHPGIQITGTQLPSVINNLTADNSSTLSLSRTITCNDVESTSAAHLIVPPGIELVSTGNATFANPLLLKASTTPFRSIMGTFINNTANGVMGRISSEYRYTTNGFTGQTTGRSYYFSPSTYEVSSGLFNPEITTGDGNNPFSHYNFGPSPARGWARIRNGGTSLLVMNAYGIRSASSQTFTLTGFPNDQPSYSVSLPCPTGTPTNPWYYMIGNPYPAVVSWDNIYAANSNIDATIWYRTSDESGNMCTDTYNSSSGIGTNNNGTAAVDGSIPPMQAFWVRVTGTSGGNTTLTISSDTRLQNWSGINALYKKNRRNSKTIANKDMFSLYLNTKNNKDQMIIVQSSDGLDEFDKMDSYKRFEDDTSRAALYTFTPEKYKVVIQSVKPITSEKVFPIGLFNTYPTKSFRFEADFSNASSRYNYFIEDTKYNVIQDLKQNPNFTFTAYSIKDSIGARFKLHVLLAPKVIVNNSVSSCSSQTVDLTAPSITQGSDNGLTYTYWLDSNATQPYSSPTNAEAGTYFIKGTAANGSYSISNPIVLTNNHPTLVVTSPSAVCSPLTVDLTQSKITEGSSKELSYTYWMDSNATISYITPTAATSGNYYIKGTDPYGCSTISTPIQVTIKTPPTVVVTSQNTVCAPMTVDLTKPEITLGSSEGLTFSYWTNSDATINYSTPTAAINGSYYIKGTDSNGCYTVSEPVHVIINNPPTIVTTFPDAVCSPLTVDLTKPEITSGSLGGLTFTYWTDSYATINYSTPASASNGVYYIKATDSNGCYTISEPIVATVNTSPTVITTNPAPVIFPATVDLTAPEISFGSTEGLDYTYWLDVTAISPYATPQTAIAGNYYLKGTDVNTGCSSIAGPITVVVNPITGIDNNPNDLSEVVIYSNGNQVFINNCQLNSEVTIYDMLGRLNYTGLTKSINELINCNFKTGFYIVKVLNSQNIKTEKVFIH